MFKLRGFILILLFIIQQSNATQDSYLLSHYDLKVKNGEATCRLVNHPNLPEDRRTLAGRGCMCDQECIKYKDCCKDSTYYRANEQTLPPSHHCSETTAVYLMTQCTPVWKDLNIRSLCEKSTQPLEDEDISLILPVSNIKTRETYGNQYCAICNNDLDTKNWIQFPMEVFAGEVPPGYLKSAPSKTSTPFKSYPYELGNTPQKKNCNNANNGCEVNIINNIPPIPNPSPNILLDIHLYIYNDTIINVRNTQWPIQLKTVVPSTSENLYNIFERTKRNSKHIIDFEKYASKAEEICVHAKYDPENKKFVSHYQNKIFICIFEPILPNNSTQFTRRCVPFLERKCPNGYKNEITKETCSLSTNIIYNRNKKPYRNKDCARCNGENDNNVDGTPQITRSSFSKSFQKTNQTGISTGKVNPKNKSGIGVDMSKK